MVEDVTSKRKEKAGNKEATIPAWDGGLTKAPAGFDAKKGYADPYAADKPLFTITGQNAAQYADKLSPGQLALLKKYPTYKINVYPTRRSAALPQAQYDDIRKNAGAAELTADGNGVVKSGTSTIPFPFPKAGEDLLWNHNFRWRGGSVWSAVNSCHTSVSVLSAPATSPVRSRSRALAIMHCSNPN